MWRWGRSVGTFGAILLAASSAWACPLCRSGTGERVRAGIFDGDFGYHLFMTLLPFPVLLGIVALIHCGPPRRDGRDRRIRPPAPGSLPRRSPTTEERP